MNIFRSSIFSILGTLSGFVISIGSGVLIARLLGPAGKGEIYLMTQLISLIILLMSLGFSSSYIYHIKSNKISSSVALSHALILCIFIGVILYLNYLSGYFLVKLLTLDSLSDSRISVMMALIGMGLIATLFTSILQSQDEGVAKYSIYSIFADIFYASGLTWFVLVMNWGVNGVLLALGAQVTVRVLLVGKAIYSLADLSASFNFTNITGTLFKYGIVAFIANVAMTSLFRLDIFVINRFLDANAIGLYSVAVNLGELMLLIPSAIGVALFPYLTSLSNNERAEKICFVTRMGIFLGIFCALIFGLFGQFVINLLFGLEFSSSYASLLILLPGLIALSTVFGFTNYYSSIGRPSVNAIAFSLSALANLGLNVWLVPAYGVAGAAASSTFVYVITMIGYVIHFNSIEKVSLKNICIITKQDINTLFVGGKNILTKEGSI